MGADRPRRCSCESDPGLSPEVQLPLLGPRGGLKPRLPPPPGGEREIVQVLVDTNLPHLDRLFDYTVPASLVDRVHIGVRVKVRLAGRDRDGFVISRSDTSEHAGRVLPLRKVVSEVPVLPEPLARLCRAVADHYAGSMSDVVRLAVPPRHAAAEAASWPGGVADGDADPAPGPAAPERAAGVGVTGPVDALSEPAGAVSDPGLAMFARGLDQAPRAAWCCPPARDWVTPLAELVSAAARTDAPALVVLPDRTDVDRFTEALAALLPTGLIAVLRADLGPRARYTQYLRALSGQVAVVVGTRSAAFAPLPGLALSVIWDDGDPSHAEQRAPYPHARDVLAIRSHQQQTAFLCAGYTQTPEVAHWVARSWLRQIEPDRSRVRADRPVTSTPQDTDRSPLDTVARLAPSAISVLRSGLASGPVLVQVSRRGYLPVVACATCRELTKCPQCEGPLALREADSDVVECRRCGVAQPDWRCAECGGTRLRAVAVGATRTAHELGRLLPGHPIQISTSEHPIPEVPDRPEIVVATAGMEPRAAGGYRAAFFPDAETELWRPGAAARQEALRRWFNAAALLHPGAPLELAADPGDPAVQAFIRWDPITAAEAELAERAELHLPPAVRLVQVDGQETDIEEFVAAVAEIPDLQVLGPRPLPGDAGLFRVALTAPDGSALVSRVRQIVVGRAAARVGEPLRVRVDPAEPE